MTVPRVFDSTTEQTMEWLKVLCKEEGITDERLAYAALCAALHQLRDRREDVIGMLPKDLQYRWPAEARNTVC